MSQSRGSKSPANDHSGNASHSRNTSSNTSHSSTAYGNTRANSHDANSEGDMSYGGAGYGGTIGVPSAFASNSSGNYSSWNTSSASSSSYGNGTSGDSSSSLVTWNSYAGGVNVHPNRSNIFSRAGTSPATSIARGNDYDNTEDFSDREDLQSPLYIDSQGQARYFAFLDADGYVVYHIAPRADGLTRYDSYGLPLYEAARDQEGFRTLSYVPLSSQPGRYRYHEIAPPAPDWQTWQSVSGRRPGREMEIFEAEAYMPAANYSHLRGRNPPLPRQTSQTAGNGEQRDEDVDRRLMPPPPLPSNSSQGPATHGTRTHTNQVGTSSSRGESGSRSHGRDDNHQPSGSSASRNIDRSNR